MAVERRRSRRRRADPSSSFRPSSGRNGEEDRIEEERVVAEFRRVLVDRDLLPPRHDNYYTKRRFLKGRGYNIDKAILMWSDMLQWRSDFGTDSIWQRRSCWFNDRKPG